MVPLTSLILPVVLTAVALFFASFLSWMVLKLHNRDWKPFPDEEAAMNDVRKWNLPTGSYMFPFAKSDAEMKSEEFQKKYKEGPRGIFQNLPAANMGVNLGLTIVYFLMIAWVLAYLNTIAFKPGAEFLTVFRFTFTAAFFMFFAAMMQQSIWFKNRITGHLIESLAYAAIAAGLFAALWPAS